MVSYWLDVLLAGKALNEDKDLAFQAGSFLACENEAKGPLLAVSCHSENSLLAILNVRYREKQPFRLDECPLCTQ